VQGGLAQGPAPGDYVATGATGPPAPTGAPALPSTDAAQAPPTGTAGAGPGASVTVDTAGMGPVETALAGTAWSKEDVELVLQTVSTLILLYWVVMESNR